MSLESKFSVFENKVESRKVESSIFKVGPLVQIGSINPVRADGSVYCSNNGYAQTIFVLEKTIRVLKQTGAKLDDITDIKMYVVDMSKFSEYIKAFSEFFKEIKPKFSLEKTNKVKHNGELIEIEIDAYIH